MNAEKRVKELEDGIMAVYDDNDDVMCPITDCDKSCDTCAKYKLFLIAEEIFYRRRQEAK